MKLTRMLVTPAIVAAVALSQQAVATSVPFDTTATFDGSPAVSGTLTIDTTLGKVTSSTLTDGTNVYSFIDDAGSGSGYSPGANAFIEFIGTDDTFSNYLSLAFATQTLVGYSGGNLYSITDTSPNNVASAKIADDGNFYVLTAGSLTAASLAAAVPEPATWAMMILGFGLVGFALRRRQTITTRVVYTA